MNSHNNVDQAWDLLEDGDIEGARAAHARAAKHAPNDPDVIALGASLAAASGEIETALDALARAVELAPDQARFLLMIADLELHAIDDPEAAIDACNRALDLTTEEEELIDAVLLKAEALVSIGDRDEDASEVLAELEGCAIEDPSLLCKAADLHLTLGALDAAERAYAAAVELGEDWADGYHGLGLVYEARGDKDKMVAAWERTKELDHEAGLPPWHMSTDEFEAVASAALAELPDKIRAYLENVPILIDDVPSMDLIREGFDPRLLGIFSGTPLPEKSSLDAQPHLDTVQLFQHNLERASMSPEHLADEIRITVLHETAHFFGLDDDDLEAMGLG